MWSWNDDNVIIGAAWDKTSLKIIDFDEYIELIDVDVEVKVEAEVEVGVNSVASIESILEALIEDCESETHEFPCNTFAVLFKKSQPFS